MSMNIDKAHAALCAWLTRADENYMGGRLLARAGGHLVAGNLLWLCLEQMAKVLILQKRIHAMPFPEGSPERRSEDMTEILALLEREAKSIRPHHEVDPLLAELGCTYPDMDLVPHKVIMAKLQEFFGMRYYKEAGHKLTHTEVDSIDAVYFLMRDRVVLDVGMGRIDTLLLMHANGKLHLRTLVQEDVFRNNNSLRPRPGCSSHPKFRMGWAGPGMNVAATLSFPQHYCGSAQRRD
jgi:hypothetical protein